MFERFRLRVQLTLEPEQNITVIQSGSSTGKTTLMGMLRDYEEQGAQSGVSVMCDKRCRVLASLDWQERLHLMEDSISKRVYNKAYPYSKTLPQAAEQPARVAGILTEDSNAGYQMFRCIAEHSHARCDTAKGKPNLFLDLARSSDIRNMLF